MPRPPSGQRDASSSPAYFLSGMQTQKRPPKGPLPAEPCEREILLDLGFAELDMLLRDRSYFRWTIFSVIVREFFLVT